MIRINVDKENNQIKKIILEGHANYDEYGKDIVCAAVSATYLCTVNAILSLNKNSIQVNNNKAKQEIIVNTYDEVTNTLLNNMINCLESLEKQYPKNINLR